MSIELAALFSARSSPISSASFDFPNVEIEKAKVNQSSEGKLYLVIMRYLCERRYTNKYSVNGIVE